MSNEAQELALDQLLDAYLAVVAGRPDHEVILLDPLMRALAPRYGLDVSNVPPVPPMTVRAFRVHWRAAKARLAQLSAKP